MAEAGKTAKPGAQGAAEKPPDSFLAATHRSCLAGHAWCIRKGIITEFIALVDDAPKPVGRRPEGQPLAVAQAYGDDPLIPPFRIEGEHAGAALPRSRP